MSEDKIVIIRVATWKSHENDMDFVIPLEIEQINITKYIFPFESGYVYIDRWIFIGTCIWRHFVNEKLAHTHDQNMLNIYFYLQWFCAVFFFFYFYCRNENRKKETKPFTEREREIDNRSKNDERIKKYLIKIDEIQSNVLCVYWTGTKRYWVR